MAGSPAIDSVSCSTLTIGNLTRFDNLRKYAPPDPDAASRMDSGDACPDAGAARALRRLPWALAVRLWLLRQMWPALRALARQDVVMLHLFEAEIACVARSYLFRRPGAHQQHGRSTHCRSRILPALPESDEQAGLAPRLSPWLDHGARHVSTPSFCSQRGAAVSSRPAATSLASRSFRSTSASTWRRARPRAPARRASDARPRLLSVGEDFDRKGGGLLLRVFERTPPHSAQLLACGSRRKLREILLAMSTFIGTCNRTMLPSSICTRVATCWCCPRPRIWCRWVVLEAMATQSPGSEYGGGRDSRDRRARPHRAPSSRRATLTRSPQPSRFCCPTRTCAEPWGGVAENAWRAISTPPSMYPGFFR